MHLNFNELLGVGHDYPGHSTSKNGDPVDQRVLNPTRYQISCIDVVRFPTV